MESIEPTSYEQGLWKNLPNTQEIRLEKSQKSKLQSRVDTLLKDISGQSRKYTFTVYKSPDTHVIHARGGHIYIPDGLLKITKNDTEIRFILAHEIAHWENGDIHNDKARIAISPGDIRETECQADKTAQVNLGTRTKDAIVKLRKRLHREYERPLCDEE